VGVEKPWKLDFYLCQCIQTGTDLQAAFLKSTFLGLINSRQTDRYLPFEKGQKPKTYATDNFTGTLFLPASIVGSGQG
jgi:hypothetical protein